ncbi:MAG TPA: CYTH domain-containing protein [Gemmatimonadaceae bacterium]|nr:CYTH domain-containing protein [Gemmatimonadaceae bacterium]
MREVELKSVAPAPDAVVAALLAAGAERTFEGRLADRRYDTTARSMLPQDLVLRLRVYASGGQTRATLEWKGPTEYERGYKVREEFGADVSDPAAMAAMLERLGYVVIVEIDRDIAQFRCRGATVRIERYPRMDVLVEVEGAPDAIEAAIAATGLAREGFTAERLPDFVRRYEERTGERAALCDRELAGDYRYSAANA